MEQVRERIPRRTVRVAVTLALIALCSCKDAPPEPYIRVGEAAPVDLAGSGPALVAFWASWCPPCVQEAPGLRSLAADPPRGLELLVVPVGEDDAAARAAFGGAARVLPRARQELLDALRVGELPVAFLVVRGRVIARFEGPRAWDGAAARTTLARLTGEAVAVDRPSDG